MTRKIIHVDMDAFYASVEQRDDPALRGQPVIVGGAAARGVVAAASYEARAFGIHSAMPGVRAKRLCPNAVFVAPDFARYKAVSAQVREIFSRYTNLIEPLSLDEAFLDVSGGSETSRAARAPATEIAKAIRADIADELQLAASAGIAPNKFLAKVASDWNKPNGQWVIKPHQVDAFVRALPVKKIPGVGAVTARKLADMNVIVCADLRRFQPEQLAQRFGKYGLRLWELAHGIDERPVRPHRERKSISAEDTFADDRRLDQLEPAIRALADKTWRVVERLNKPGRTVVLKLKTAQFQTLTRSHTLDRPVKSVEQLAEVALQLRARVGLPTSQRYRLVGVGVSGFETSPADDAAEQPDLFDVGSESPSR